MCRSSPRLAKKTSCRRIVYPRHNLRKKMTSHRVTAVVPKLHTRGLTANSALSPMSSGSTASTRFPQFFAAFLSVVAALQKTKGEGRCQQTELCGDRHALELDSTPANFARRTPSLSTAHEPPADAYAVPSVCTRRATAKRPLGKKGLTAMLRLPRKET